jgi:CMP-N-acetylneuraminic acid synthetase
MSVLLVIPARGGSKGIPRKNLTMVAGRPLIAYAIKNGLSAEEVDRVIVSTEDEEISSVARAYGAEIPFMRPPELATDDISLIPVIAHAARSLRDPDFSADIVISLQPTTPFISGSIIDQAIRLQRETGCDSVTSVVKVTHNHPYRVQSIMDHTRLTPYYPEGERFLQRQDLPASYAFSGGLYLRKRQLLDTWSGKDFCLGEDRHCVIVNEKEALNIDTPIDLAVCKTIMEMSTSKQDQLP